MFRVKAHRLALLLGLLAPVPSFASSHFCIAVNGGFGDGGTSYVGSFSLPSEGSCAPWSGFTKTASSVILISSGAGCASSDGKVLTVSVFSADPSYFGSGQTASDYIQLSRKEAKGSFGSGEDNGQFSGSAEEQTCTSTLLHLPDSHD